jgi:hypothetical protein
VCDPDLDADGVANESDNCVQLYNPDQADHEGDGLGDVCDPDDDGDGVGDALDNCPLVTNATQDDFDDDMVGDACDLDDDADGVEDAADVCPATVAGDVVHPDQGCSLEQLCPCAGPMGESRPWAGSLQFVRCVYESSTEFYTSGLIGLRDRNRFVLEAVKSGCGYSRDWYRYRRHGWCDRRAGAYGGRHGRW